VNQRTENFRISGQEEQSIKDKALNWVHTRFSAFLFLDSGGYEDPYGRWEWLLLAGEKEGAIDSPEKLESNTGAGWRYGHLCYELGRELIFSDANARPALTDDQGWKALKWSSPVVVVGKQRGDERIFISAEDTDAVLQQVFVTNPPSREPLPGVCFKPVLSKEQYIRTIETLREHIASGDCYEINFCNARFAQHGAKLDALSAYLQLRDLSPAPFSAFYRQGSQYAVCASPERYLQKKGRTIRSQPIKGTARRGDDAASDSEAKNALRQSAKERAENVMIVDLVRSDLAHSCEVGSVQVEELFGIQTFPTVHQMVSTISGTLREDQRWWDSIRHSFPMGSMTGAPKEMVMSLIERYEPVRRGLFSGSLGYLTPEGDFDFNVVIRSLFYDASNGHLSYSTGGAITWGSDAESEWEETLLKGRALENLFR
jgi:para-aminobenzoate synthetase component 1